jgi:hypothetical protein
MRMLLPWGRAIIAEKAPDNTERIETKTEAAVMRDF